MSFALPAVKFSMMLKRVGRMKEEFMKVFPEGQADAFFERLAAETAAAGTTAFVNLDPGEIAIRALESVLQAEMGDPPQ